MYNVFEIIEIRCFQMIFELFYYYFDNKFARLKLINLYFFQA